MLVVPWAWDPAWPGESTVLPQVLWAAPSVLETFFNSPTRSTKFMVWFPVEHITLPVGAAHSNRQPTHCPAQCLVVLPPGSRSRFLNLPSPDPSLKLGLLHPLWTSPSGHCAAGQFYSHIYSLRHPLAQGPSLPAHAPGVPASSAEAPVVRVGNLVPKNRVRAVVQPPERGWSSHCLGWAAPLWKLMGL